MRPARDILPCCARQRTRTLTELIVRENITHVILPVSATRSSGSPSFHLPYFILYSVRSESIPMLRARSLATCHRVITRAYATATSPHALVLLEHKNGTIESSSLSALTAAQQLGGSITGLIVGSSDQVPTVLERAKKYVYFTSPVLHFLNPLLPLQAERSHNRPTFLRTTVFFPSPRGCLSAPRKATSQWLSIHPYRLCPLFFCKVPPPARRGKARRSRRL